MIIQNPMQCRKRSFVIISYAWKWLFFTKHSWTLRQRSETLCNKRPCYFPFRRAATVTVQFAMYSGATEDRRHETRQTRERGNLLKSFHSARARVHRSANIKWSPLYHSYLFVLLRGRFPGSILPSPLSSVLFALSFVA